MHHRFPIDSLIDPAEPAAIRGDEFHHAVKVRRIRVGETVEVFDSSGRSFEAVVDHLGSDEAVVRITREVPSRESPLRLTLGLAMIQPDKFELVLQKATELGVTRIVPIVSERTEIRLERAEKKLDRWERIIAEAVKQCGRSSVPVLASPTRFQEVVSISTPRFILDADASRSSLDLIDDELTMLIGPEGGFSGPELDLARKAGCLGLRIGPRRLRAETAAIAAVVLAQSRWGDMGNDER